MASDDGVTKYELLDAERDNSGTLVPNRGLLALPAPATGDLFFDIEGARYYSEDGREFGLQYLFGIVDTAETDEAGHPRYTQIWAFDRHSEKRAFEELIDFITERRARRPGLHVYHYNHYEPTSVDHLTELHGTRQEAVGRLMGRFATREDEVDDLFRLGVFVDLYRVVRQGVRASVELLDQAPRAAAWLRPASRPGRGNRQPDQAGSGALGTSGFSARARVGGWPGSLRPSTTQYECITMIVFLGKSGRATGPSRAVAAQR